MRKFFILLLFSVSEAVVSHAQTMQWAVRPTSARLEGYGMLVKMKKEGKCGLIDHNGHEIVPVAYDSIMPFRDGYALVLNRVANKLRIEGILTEGDYYLQPTTEEVYLTRYAWFSEGKMPVTGNGGWGYLGTDGNMAIPIQFHRAYPFSDGWAAVEIDKHAYYINRNMNYLNVEAGFGNLAYASTFSGGKAVVYGRNMKGYVINRRGRVIGPYRVKAENLTPNAEDNSVGSKVQNYQEQMQQLPLDNSYEVFRENNKFGYRHNGYVVLPAQLDSAEPVKGGYANVKYSGQNGIVRVVDGNVGAVLENNVIKMDDTVNPRGFMQVMLPQDMEDATIQLRMTDTEGKNYLLQANNTQGVQRNYTFFAPFKPDETITRKCFLTISSDNLILWEKQFEITFDVPVKVVEPVEEETPVEVVVKPASFLIGTPRKKAETANPSDVFFVSVPVSNVGDERGTVIVTLYVNDVKVGTGTVNVRPHGTANAVIGIPGVKRERFVRLKATLPDGQKAEKDRELLKPFY